MVLFPFPFPFPFPVFYFSHSPLLLLPLFCLSSISCTSVFSCLSNLPPFIPFLLSSPVSSPPILLCPLPLPLPLPLPSPPSRATMEVSLPMARLVQERHTQLKEERKPCVGSSRECQRRSSSVSTLQHTMHLHLSTARGQSSDCPIHLQWNLSIEDTLNRGHLSNEDTVCSPNHVDLSTNLPLN